MSAETLTREDSDFALWEQEMAAGVKKNLGATACSGCPLLKNNVCPGKASSLQECPPETKIIKKSDIPEALMDDSVASITADGSGGYHALPAMAQRFQTPLVVPNKPPQKPKPQAAAPKPSVEQGRAARKPEQHRPHGGGKLTQTLGELAAILVFGGKAMAPVKK